MYSPFDNPDMSWSVSRICVVIALLLLAMGCATPPDGYEPTEAYYAQNQLIIDDGPQIERGRPSVLLDGINHYLLSLPVKLLLWNWQVLDHKMADEDQRILEHYLDMNALRSVKVRHNQYAPIAEFKRLLRNKEVGWFYRYTFGIVTWLKYTLLPDRLFAGIPLIGGGDHFNPFTNTVNVYSSDITILLHEGGHAKDYVQTEMKGTALVALRLVPGINLIQEGTASTDAIRFLHCIHNTDDELRAYRTLIPAYSTYIGGYFEGGLVIGIPIILVGHVTGRFQARARRKDMEKAEDVSGLIKDDFLPPFCVPFPTSD